MNSAIVETSKIFKISLLGFCTVLFMIASPVYSQTSILWNSTMEVATPNFGNNRPRVVLDRSDNPVIIWGNSGNVMLSKWNGSGFGIPVQVNPSNMPIAEANWMGPDIASHGDTIYVVVKQTPETDTSSHVWCMRSTDGGSTFSSPVRVDYVGNNLSRFTEVTTDDIGNPIIAFLKIAANFSDHQWAVIRSQNFGNSFSSDVLASGWSSATTEACDCCPGEIASEGSNVAMLYRDNNSNIRDNWVGISTDSANSFTAGWNVDQLNWLYNSCPSSGPDGVIIGDTVYSVSMNAGTGSTLVYFGRSSITAASAVPAQQLAAGVSGLVYQNFPRIVKKGNAVAMVWKQAVNGRSELPIIISDDIRNGLPNAYDTVSSQFVNNPDVAMTEDKVYVVWQDGSTGTVKFRSGTMSTATFIESVLSYDDFKVFPNPASQSWSISIPTGSEIEIIELLDYSGRLISEYSQITFDTENFKIGNEKLIPGIYILKITSKQKSFSYKLVKR